MGLLKSGEKQRFKLRTPGAFHGWGWKKHNLPHAQDRKDIQIFVMIHAVNCLNPPADWARYRNSDTVLITGDGGSLSRDVRQFEEWGIGHDLFAVNRSLIFHQRQVQHWCAVDLEETIWFAHNLSRAQCPERNVIRHTIGDLPGAVDFRWEMVYDWEDDLQKLVISGNSGYFAVLASIAMGYERIILAGMPLNSTCHWYEDPEKARGPNWAGHVYTQWMDFKMQVPEAERVRSMGGYSAFILGTADREFACSAR